ncbi:MAG: protein-L-isoaspartate O-methyltransferase family protein [Gammaproteobacteria bacterium]
MGNVDTNLARHNMVEQQVRPWEVLNPIVLNTLEQIPRENFVPSQYKNLAYADTEIPLGNGFGMMHPVVEGRILQLLDIQPQEDILEIGTGSGFLTACLGHLGHHVTSIEIDETLSQTAAERLVEHGILNVSLVVDDATNTDNLNQQYDVIAITGAMYELPIVFKQALKPGGRLFVITGESPTMEARLITRTDEDSWSDQMIFEYDLKPLIHAEKGKQFIF